MKQIKLGDITVDVELKDIKNVHLSVSPPQGRVRIAAPERMSLDTIRIYALSKIPWIRQQQKKFKEQSREAPREYLNKESHYFLGSRYQLKVKEHNAPPKVDIHHKTIDLYVRPDTAQLKRQEIIEEWYRTQLKQLILPIISKWERKMGVKVKETGIKKMKTKWGTCNPDAGRIWLNLELAKKPLHCIEYIIVHEMVHLLERHHNDKFVAYLDRFLPEWKESKRELNRLPVGHREWGY